MVEDNLLEYKQIITFLSFGENKHLAIDALRERLRTHKVFTKDQWFYFNYHKFSIKSYVLDVY